MRTRLSENEHLRPLFVLWLQRLTRAVSAGEADDDTAVQIDVRDRDLPTLSFTATVTKRSAPPPDSAVIKGFEDVVLVRDRAVVAIGELKAPFSALSRDASPSLQNQALSQSYAEMQGFMATKALGHLLGTAGAATAAAAAAAASSADDAIADTSSSHRWCVSFLTDGFVLYVSFGSPHHRGEASHQLPPVYTSGDAAIVDEDRFTQQLLYAVASVSTGPGVDVSQATADFYALPNCSGEENAANGADRDEQPRPPPRPREPAIDDGPTCLTWDDGYEEFVAEEREAVGRLKALLAPSRLSRYTLQQLGARRPVF